VQPSDPSTEETLSLARLNYDGDKLGPQANAAFTRSGLNVGGRRRLAGGMRAKAFAIAAAIGPRPLRARARSAPAPAPRFTPEPKRRNAVVSTSVRSADISLPQPRVLAAEALLPVAAVQAARPPLRVWAAAQPLPVSAATVSVASRLASSPASVAKAVERVSIR